MPQQIFLVLAMLAMLLGNGNGAPPFQGALNQDFEIPSRYIDETGHNIWEPFLSFYDAHGGAATFGLPLTDRLDEDGMQVQYFERVRLELHPDAPDNVHISPLGRILSEHRMHEPPFLPHDPASLDDTSLYISETQHHISHMFRSFWETHGGVELFGYPISEAFAEEHPDGHTIMVQYFERTRLEYHLPHPGAAPDIQIAMLGREYILTRAFPPELLAASRPIVKLSSSVMRFTPSPAELRNVELALESFDGLRVMPGEQVSFLNTLGDITSERGYMPGAAIIGGGIGLEMGGGICYASTVLYRSVLAAGLENIERHQHTLALADFNDIPGLDSAVYTSSEVARYRTSMDLDLRWRNNMDDPILITTEVISTGRMVVSLWGYDDGRITELYEPTTISQGNEEHAPIWLYDASMPTCDIRSLYGNPGMHVQRERIVRDANGNPIVSEPIVSSYAGARDVYLYGPGIDLRIAQNHSLAEAQAACRAMQQEQRQRSVPSAPPSEPDVSPPAIVEPEVIPETMGDQVQSIEQPAPPLVPQSGGGGGDVPPQVDVLPAVPATDTTIANQIQSVIEQQDRLLIAVPAAPMPSPVAPPASLFEQFQQP